MTASFHESLLALTEQPVERAPGLIESLQYGFALRYDGYRLRGGSAEAWRFTGLRDFSGLSAEAWHTLDCIADDLDDSQLDKVLPVMEHHAWAAGSNLSLGLAGKLWSRLSAGARGRFLAGAARHLPSHYEQDEKNLADFILTSLPLAELDAQSAAECGANAIRIDRSDILTAVLEHPDFDPDGAVERLSDEYERFHKEISQHATRVLDVLLEAAVRFKRAEAVELLLKAGASPNLPCWNLERNYNEWFSLLSYSINPRGYNESERIANLLLEQGANPRGLPCEDVNKPLKLSLDNRLWKLADRLLGFGADFSGGHVLTPDEREEFERWPLRHGISADELKWVREKIAPLLPLARPWEVPMFYTGGGQGGSFSTFLDSLLDRQSLDQLKHFEARGLSIHLTPAIFVDIVDWKDLDVLLYLLRNEPNLERLVFRARRRNPSIGTNRLQAWLCRPQDDRVNELLDFDSGDQEPLTLPDGSRFYVYLDAVAPPDHNNGPLKEGYFWLEEHSPVHRRRNDHVLVREMKREWHMVEIPSNDYQMIDMMPMVKEMNGRFFLPGIHAGKMQFVQIFPEEWQSLVSAWMDGPFEQAKKAFRRRIQEQPTNGIAK